LLTYITVCICLFNNKQDR